MVAGETTSSVQLQQRERIPQAAAMCQRVPPWGDCPCCERGRGGFVNGDCESRIEQMRDFGFAGWSTPLWVEGVQCTPISWRVESTRPPPPVMKLARRLAIPRPTFLSQITNHGHHGRGRRRFWNPFLFLSALYLASNGFPSSPYNIQSLLARSDTTPLLPITCPTTAANCTASLQGARGLPLSAEAEAPQPAASPEQA